MSGHGALTALMIGLAMAGCATIKGGAPDASVATARVDTPVGRTFEVNERKFKSCARDSVTIQTGITQRVKLGFEIGGDGFPRNARILEMSAPDPDLHECILKTLRRLQFAPTKADPRKKVIYPLVLKPA